MSKSSRNRGPIPDRWLKCPRKARDLIVGKFMALKTPLSSSYDDQVPPGDRFTPGMFFNSYKSKKIKFGLWIDLTNTNRFYDKKDVEEEGCRYWKLSCLGHGSCPTTEQTEKFVTVVDNFIAQNPLKCIAVHCTHGFNRTGFLIVSYLVKKMDIDVEMALHMFSQVRSPGIYKQDYLEELYKRHGDDVKDMPRAPELPAWCYENGQLSDDSQSNSKQLESRDFVECSSSNLKRKNRKTPVFMEGVPGVEVFCEQQKAQSLQKKVQSMCKWKSKDFPGSQPVSMDMNNISLLQKKPYMVSWKADGTRYMMLINNENEVYFFDRDHNVFKVNGLRFLHQKDLKKHLQNTLLDGEMVIDEVNDKNIPRYLVYDIITFEGKDVGKEQFYPTRLQCINDEIIKPRHRAIELGIINKAMEPFSVRKKEFWHITQAANLLGDKFARTLSHKPDGLIFQPSNDPYISGRCDDVLKWKPLDMNSVDFRLRLVKPQGVGIVSITEGHLFVGQMSTKFDTIRLTKVLKNLDNKIIECKFKDNKWEYMRERTDKSFPNSYETAKAVCESIKNPVTKEYLLNYIEKERFNDDRQPPHKKVRR